MNAVIQWERYRDIRTYIHTTDTNLGTIWPRPTKSHCTVLSECNSHSTVSWPMPVALFSQLHPLCTQALGLTLSNISGALCQWIAGSKQLDPKYASTVWKRHVWGETGIIITSLVRHLTANHLYSTALWILVPIAQFTSIERCTMHNGSHVPLDIPNYHCVCVFLQTLVERCPLISPYLGRIMQVKWYVDITWHVWVTVPHASRMKCIAQGGLNMLKS